MIGVQCQWSGQEIYYRSDNRVQSIRNAICAVYENSSFLFR